MTRFDPIMASDNIKQSYIDYITSAFNIADTHYASELKSQLAKDGFTAKGPYLDVSGSFKAGKSISQLINDGEASSLFSELEPIPEKEREIKLDRTLYLHQENALRRANAGNSLVVTTGTGSGKTECFLIPVINALLREKEQGTLEESGIRAIIIYPMNALANDQMKRMRKLLKNYPDITFGLYNGNTEHSQAKALAEYRRIHAKSESKEPLPNELISREKMQQTPPHILITNYSMLEYMLLRPKDDKVFSSARLRFVVLDEAHIYKGATGMETAMLMRRLRARLNESYSAKDKIQYILTSATLGDKNADQSIVDFGRQLCGVEFKPENIIRSEDASPAVIERLSFPTEFFHDIASGEKTVRVACETYGVPDYAQGCDDNEKLYELLLHSDLYFRFREATKTPKTILNLRSLLSTSKQELIDFVSVCTRAEKGNASLVKAKYHYFVRALEGAYITLSEPRSLYLNRKETNENGQAVFEIAICEDCGRIALVGKIDRQSGKLIQVSRKSEKNPDECDFYLIWDENTQNDIAFDDDDDIDAECEEGENDFVICPQCGVIGSKADLHFGNICDCQNTKYISLRRVNRTKTNKIAKCPACGYGSFRSFYLGADAATSVLCTELYEQLPDSEVIQSSNNTETTQSSLTTNPFARVKKQEKKQTRKKERQFLCFSDSRSEAAFFANYLEKSYLEFIRRRGIYKVAKDMQQEGEFSISASVFADRLTRVFEKEHSFDLWSPDENKDQDSLHEASKQNAWIALLNELFNARRGTSMASMGVISFEYMPNDPNSELDLPEYFSNYNMSAEEGRHLLELLILDACYSGALNAGEKYSLNDAEREYIFFTPYEKKLVKCKDSDTAKKLTLVGWSGRTRENGKSAFYPNTRIQRICRATGMSEKEANDFLIGYWDWVLTKNNENAEHSINLCDFRIRVNSDPSIHTYRCKKCGRITTHNVKGCCAVLRCNGQLEEINPESYFADNHYMKLYNSDKMQPLQIKEHTAQLSRNRQTQYQEAFVNGNINALSCSTTFEMGVDVGGLETVCMRDVPPSPSNYVQRAGRAGRASHTAAFVMTFAKLSSHDFTYYENPENIIMGKISAPVFSLQNKKVIFRHIFAVALSDFFAKNEDVYCGDNATVLLNEDGFERLCEYLATPNSRLQELLKASVPQSMHDVMGITDNSWVNELVGEDGILKSAVERHRKEVKELERAVNAANNESKTALYWELKKLRCSKSDNCTRSLIDFLARNNVLPKYGFPVDTVELQIAGKKAGNSNEDLSLARDLQMAIAEYAPGSEVIADGKLYTSRYIRLESDRKRAAARGNYAKCPSCGEYNFSHNPMARRLGLECISCGEKIGRNQWMPTIEPRLGFITDKTDAKDAPLKRPERDYKTDDYYIGDQDHDLIKRKRYSFNGVEVELLSTANDSLAVVGSAKHNVCPCCGWTSDANGSIKVPHNTSRGYPCKNDDGRGETFHLAHVFKTDVVKLLFFTPDATDYPTMLSVMYALLEGLSRELGIERTDLKGCLHLQNWNQSGRLLISIVLYDAVAGGAGHVRRLVTDDGVAFSKVLHAAYKVVNECNCEPSCYHCIRNYYNQAVHDDLDRYAAKRFLENWLGSYEEVEVEEEPASGGNNPPAFNNNIEVSGSDFASEYASWRDICSGYGIEFNAQSWDDALVNRNCLIMPSIVGANIAAEPYFVWSDAKVMVVESGAEDLQNSIVETGWKALSIDIDGVELHAILTNRREQ